MSMTTREVAEHIDAFKYWCETNEENGVITIPKFLCEHIVEILDVAIEALKEQRQHGEWVEKHCDYGVYYCCSNCHKMPPNYECDYKEGAIKTNFCPNCGADMRKRGEAE